MKNLLPKLIIIIGCTIGVLWIIGRATGGLQYYTVPTPSMEPTIKPKDWIFSSNLPEPKLQGVVCYKTPTDETYVSRLMGLPGQIFEMKNGLVYINEKLSDDSTKIYRDYILSGTIFSKYSDKLKNLNVGLMNDSMYHARLTTADLAVFGEGEKPELINYPATGDMYFSPKHPTWSIDNLGPMVIPQDSCIVISDNRHNALDSRYLGYIPLSNIKGVVLNKN